MCDVDPQGFKVKVTLTQDRAQILPLERFQRIRLTNSLLMLRMKLGHHLLVLHKATVRRRVGPLILLVSLWDFHEIPLYKKGHF